MIAEGIVASTRAILSVNKALPAFPRELSVHFRHPSMERSVAKLHGERVVSGPLGLQINRRTRGIFAGRLAIIEFVGVIKRHSLHGGERELAKVNGSVLRIRQANSIDVNTHMLRSERTDIDGLQSTKPAIILNLNACEVLQGIGNRRSTQGLQVGTAQCLRRRDSANGLLRRDSHLVQLLYAVCWILRTGTCCHSKYQYDSQNRLQIVIPHHIGQST